MIVEFVFISLLIYSYDKIPDEQKINDRLIYNVKETISLKKQYWYVILTYIVMQFSGILGVPLLLLVGVGSRAETRSIAIDIVSGYWAVFSFFVAFVITLYILRHEIKDRHKDVDKRVSRSSAIVWAVVGVFMALAAQSIAASIEINLFGINVESENTRRIIEMVKVTPLLIIVTSIIGPILEEIIFRKIIFGSIYQRFNFWIAAIISSLIFAVVHLDFTHLLIYTAMGFTFSFLYIKTKRIIVPIFAHVAMNTFVVITQTVFADDIEKFLKQAEQMQSFIGGL